MSHPTLLIHTPLPVREPRGAQPAAVAALALQRAAHSLVAASRAIWRVLEEHGQRRANRDLARRGISLAALQAAQAREIANAYARTDPRFAADLYAAADRHEALYGNDAPARTTDDEALRSCSLNSGGQ